MPTIPAYGATYTYDAAKAVAWAKNSSNVDSFTDKCARFVSRCLREGGLSDVSFGTPGKLVAYLEDKGYGTTYRVNDTNLTKLKAGDVIAVFCSKKHDSDRYYGIHTMFVTEVDQSAKTLRYSQANRNRCNVKMTFSSLKNYANISDNCSICGTNANNYVVFVSMNTTSDTTPQNVNLITNLNYSGKNYLYGTDFSSLDTAYWYSRDTSVTTLSIDRQTKHNGYNSLKIVNASAGSPGKDLSICTMTNDRSPNGAQGDKKSMILSFWAKASTAGTRAYFRWGYESTSNYRSVALTTSWAKYTVRMDKTEEFNNYIQPYIDKAGTVWITEMQLEDGTTATGFAPETGGYYRTTTVKQGGKFSMPPEPVRPGYTFNGWYTAASGGTQITGNTTATRHRAVYAHWKEGNKAVDLYTYLNYSGKNYLYGTDFSSLDTAYWYSRDTSVTTLSIDRVSRFDGYNTLKIINASAGSPGKDLSIRTITNDRSPDGAQGDNKNMILSFWAKASTAGTRAYFRWGYESTSSYRSVALTTSWAKYTVRMDKTDQYNNYMQPYIDKAGTVWIAEMQLEDGTTATDFVPETKGLYQTVNEYVSENYILPSQPERSGYAFDGWYTAASGGTKITQYSTVGNGHLAVYAHWKKDSTAHTLVATPAKDPTCTEAGNTAYWTCSDCGKYYSDAKGTVEIAQNSWVIPATGHIWNNGRVTTAATCINEGEILYTCTVCNATRIEALDKLPHTIRGVAASAPTCTAAGNSAYYVCDSCGRFFSDAEGTSEIGEGSWVIAANGHSFGEWKVIDAQTCENKGSEQRICTVCGFTETRNLDPNGHSWEEDFTIDQEPGCTTDGSKSIHCENCGQKMEVTAIPALGHDWDTENVVFNWADDLSSAEAVFTCRRDPGHIETVRAAVTPATEAGIMTYTAKVEFNGMTYTDQKSANAHEVIRIYGSNRYETCIRIADYFIERNGVDKLPAVVLATGRNFPDALTGAYLANVRNVPIMLIDASSASRITAYIKSHLASDGTVYILGGSGAVEDSWITGLSSYNVKRLSGSDRFETNLAILRESGVNGGDIFVCTGSNYADSLSASGVDMPILIVGNSLNDSQKQFLKGGSWSFHLVGGSSVVTARVENELKAYGTVAARVYGINRYATSRAIAEKYIGEANKVLMAYGANFPDGLCGGPLAYSMGAPIILSGSAQAQNSSGIEYANSKGITSGIVLGGPALIDDKTVRSTFGMRNSERIMIYEQ